MMMMMLMMYCNTYLVVKWKGGLIQNDHIKNEDKKPLVMMYRKGSLHDLLDKRQIQQTTFKARLLHINLCEPVD